MLFYTAAVPFGTLVRTRRDVDRLLWTTCAGVAVLQLYGFWALATGTRYARGDAWEAGVTFFRAPYSCVSLFVMGLAAAALLVRASTRTLTRSSAVVLFLAIAALGGGLLASMVRSLWISGAVGMAVVVMLVPWNPRTIKAGLALAGGIALAVAVVAAIDRLSPSSTGNWTASAIAFFMDLGSKDSTSRVTREIEWAHAIDVLGGQPARRPGFRLFVSADELREGAGGSHSRSLLHAQQLPQYPGEGGRVRAGGLPLPVVAHVRRGMEDHPRIRSPTRTSRIVATALLSGLASAAMLTTTMPC
jgi:hypothetical protein